MKFAKSVKFEKVLTFEILKDDDGVKRLFTTIVDDVNHLLPALILHRKKDLHREHLDKRKKE